MLIAHNRFSGDPMMGGASGTVDTAVTISNPPPTVAITAPAANATVQGVLAVTGTAQPTAPADKPISRVYFTVDGGSVATQTFNPALTPGSYSLPWDSSSVINSD